MISVTRHEEFEAAHRLQGHPGGCGNLHGHTYKIEVTVSGEQDDVHWGMILDFNYLKNAIKPVLPDHKFIAYCNDPFCKDIIDILDKYALEYVVYDFDPTAENMCKFFAKIIQINLSNMGIYNIKVSKVKLWETTNSYAEYINEDK